MSEEFRAAPSAVAVHDLSCVGRCALTVVIPVLAAMGIQPVPLPTAVLSTHTGGYTDMAVCDLTGFMPDCMAHWKMLDMRFDAVYSGYLADATQVEIVTELIDWQREKGRPLVVVDPVMGDEGLLYSGIHPDMPRRMHELCQQADLVTPNMTEAALLLAEEYTLRPRTPVEIQDMLNRLPGRQVVITSAPVKGVGWANVCRAQDGEGFWMSPYEPINAHYPGTGDLFASVMVGALLKGIPAESAMVHANGFVRQAIRLSHAVGGQVRFGVQLESLLGQLSAPWPEGEPTLVRP